MILYTLHVGIYPVPADEQDKCENWCDSNVNMSIIIVIAFVTIGIIMYCYRNK